MILIKLCTWWKRKTYKYLAKQPSWLHHICYRLTSLGLGKLFKLLLKGCLLGWERLHSLSQSIQPRIVLGLATLLPQYLLPRKQITKGSVLTTRFILKYLTYSTTYPQQLECKLQFLLRHDTSRWDLGSTRTHLGDGPFLYSFNHPHSIPWILGI